MKKAASILVVFLMLLGLAACGNSGGTGSLPTETHSGGGSSAGVSASSGIASEKPAFSAAGQPEQEVPFGVLLEGNGEDFGDFLDAANLNKTQEDAILECVRRVVAGYAEGELPLPVIPESEYWLNEPLPDGVEMPQRVNAGDYTVANFDEVWQVQATLPLNGGHTLLVWISQARLYNEAGKEEIYIAVDNASFA